MIRPLFKYISSLFIMFAAVSIGIAETRVGQVSPMVVSVDIGDASFETFYGGFATIRKGNAYGIINRYGKILVPYLKYEGIGRFFNGYCMVSSAGRSKFIDTLGKEIDLHNDKFYEFGYIDRTGIIDLDDGFGTQRYFYNIKTGKKYPFIKQLAYERNNFKDLIYNGYNYDFSDDLIRIEQKGKYGYVTKTGKLIVPPQFELAWSFSEGIALVANSDAFGEIKYGYLNASGQLAIPMQFSYQPRNFHCNRAFVRPKTGSPNFNFGYIDKIGNIKIKLARRPICEDFIEGYIPVESEENSSKVNFVDTAGNIIQFSDNVSFEGKQYKVTYLFPVQNGLIKIRTFNGNPTHSDSYGYATIKGDVIVPPVFESIGDFDEVAQLAPAQYRNNGKIINGYINKSGEFVIIAASSPKW